MESVLKMDMDKISRWAYTLSVLVAVIAGLVLGYLAWDAGGWIGDVATWNSYVIIILLILGIIVGLTSITIEKVGPFLIATIALVVAAGANVWAPLEIIHSLLLFWASAITSYIVAFAAPTAVIIAIIAILGITKRK